MITLTMMLIKSLTLFLALTYTISLLGAFIVFYVTAMNKTSARVHIRDIIMPSFLWAVFYFLTF